MYQIAAEIIALLLVAGVIVCFMAHTIGEGAGANYRLANRAADVFFTSLVIVTMLGVLLALVTIAELVVRYAG